MTPTRLRRKIRTSFAARNMLVITLLIGLTCVSLTGIFFYQQCCSSKEILVEEGRQLALFLATNARLGVFSENVDLLQDPMSSLFQNEATQEARVYNVEGVLLRKVTRQGAAPRRGSKPLPSPQSVLRRMAADMMEEASFENEEILQFWTPIHSFSRVLGLDGTLQMEPSANRGKVLGFVSLDLSKHPLHRSLLTLLLKICLVGLILLVTGLLVAYFVNQRITMPLQRLTERVEAFGREGEVRPVAVEGEDEVKSLALAFNAMAESLRAREREKEALEGQLCQARKMEAVGTLAGGIAHDFSNFLSVIKGYGDLLRKGGEPGEESRDYAERIVNAANKGIKLTRSLLTFTRSQVINPRVLNLNESVRAVRGLLGPLIPEKVELRLELDPGEMKVKADAGQIDQLLMNLATNARDAMPDGGVLTIATRIVSPRTLLSRMRLPSAGGLYALVSVSDTGTGMDAKVRERIFDPFFTTKEVGKGSGLGLSMVHGIVRQNHWFIDVESAPGYGSTFRLFIPLLESAGDSVPETGGEEVPGGDETILVAEDDDDVRTVTRLGLERQGYRVIEAADGEDAVEAFGRHHGEIRLLLFDVLMPRRNGVSAAEAIRKENPDLPVIFFSGFTAEMVDREGIVLDERVRLLSKPVSTTELHRAIREVLDAPRPRPT